MNLNVDLPHTGETSFLFGLDEFDAEVKCLSVQSC